MTDLNIDLKISQRGSSFPIQNTSQSAKLTEPIFNFGSFAPALDLSGNAENSESLAPTTLSNAELQQTSEPIIEHDGDATIKTTLNPDGSKTIAIEKKGIKSIEYYDSNDRLISEEIKYDDSSSTSILYNYNSEGNLISQKIIRKISRGNITRDTEYRYNELGERIGAVIKTSENGKLKTIANEVYSDVVENKSGKTIRKLYDANTQELLEILEISQEYLENGFEKSTIKTTTDSEISNIETLIDEHGNILSKFQEDIDPKTEERISFTQEINEYKDGKRLSSQIIKGKPRTKSNDDWMSSKTTKKYRADGSLLSGSYERVFANGIKFHSESQYNEQGKIVLDKSEQTDVFANTTDTSTKEFEYCEDNMTLKRVLTKGVDEGGMPYESINVFDENAKQISCDSVKYHLGVKTEEHYDALNSFVPATTVVYEQDGITKKEVIVNNFDSAGVLVSQEIKDKDGNIISTHDFSKVDGSFDTSYQLGRGDCYLLAGVNALRDSSEGQNLLRQIIDIQQDENGNNLYTISFPGAEVVRQNLLESGIAESDITIKSSYTFTEAELYEKAKVAGSNYSIGDKDVLLLESAYEQYRKDAQACIENQGHSLDSSMLYARGVENKGDNILDGGWQTDAIFLMTGKSAVVVSNQNSYEAPVCKVNSNYNMTILTTEIPEETEDIEEPEEADPPEDIEEPITPTAPTAPTAPSVSTTEIIQSTPFGSNESDSLNLDDLFNVVEQDCRDGSLDNFAVSASFNVSTQAVSGRTLKNSSHAFSISKIQGDNVYLRNPWNPAKEFIMTKDEIREACLDFSIIPLNESGEASVETVKNSKLKE